MSVPMSVKAVLHKSNDKSIDNTYNTRQNNKLINSIPTNLITTAKTRKY